MSRFFQRFAATVTALALGLAFPVLAAADSGPDAAWVMLTSLPERVEGPVFALAADPTNPQVVLAGTSRGTIYRSGDAGVSWSRVRQDLGRGVLTLAFNPFKPGQVLAGARGAGVWRSGDAGVTWSAQPGTERASVRSFAFARTMVAAGTDRGVLASRQEGPWTQLGLDQVSVGAMAPAAVNDPPRLLAGGDASRGPEALPLFASGDGGASWTSLPGPSSGSTMVAALAAGPLPPKQEIRPLLLGTNTGVFVSIDNGATWQQLSGSGTLPSTDFSQVAFAPGSTLRFYVGSDGGGSERGGLWTTTDGGRKFASLNPPVSTVTALGVSADGDIPIVYAASFRPGDHAVLLWRLRDTGQQVNGPASALPPLAVPGASSRLAPLPTGSMVVALVTGPEGPFLGMGLVALGVIVVALAAYLRRRT